MPISSFVVFVLKCKIPAASGQQNFESANNVFNVPRSMYVDDSDILLRYRFFYIIKSSMILHLILAAPFHHSGLWALNFASWPYKFRSCSSLKGVPGGKYRAFIL